MIQKAIDDCQKNHAQTQSTLNANFSRLLGSHSINVSKMPLAALY